ncbi:MAG TPA: hypothetical protein VGQ00_01165 [Candidatus Norongarragalinales archaeon]|jgi:hypothetical protein|nr:hypothetical protein [Candidatus Norongarragalinales archaeon]
MTKLPRAEPKFDFEGEAERVIEQLKSKGEVITGPSNRKLYVVGARGKGLVAESERTLQKPRATELVFYPEPQHVKLFARSNAIGKVRTGGPGYHFPGSVGSLYYQNHEGELHVAWIQGSFAQKTTPGLERKIVTRYGGWREHLLKELFERADQKGIRTVRYYSGQIISVSKDTHEPKKVNEALFEKIAANAGFETRAEFLHGGNNKYLVARKKL